ncbi:MAG: tRNA (adenosine(37)-N6)-threonylcarbamoyltransferase complex transferase subunit TsaD [Nitrospirae bacterium]|nr:tRNA (adenosine(37)-N6)-threonylcarbamoyltransferase complex transferase subunit TsaD [Candidatus Troglogloeales bacterium]MBI3598221.1 tRNA (adenosine(37)-N6)-threonylcarbamoyltransferase complex transferase subunit TsaD [Candidatus Troglogloeales bacterium]
MDRCILGIETSCDETAVAVINASRVTNLLSSQIDLHKPYGGIVPELACRRHIEAIGPLLNELLRRAGCALTQLDAVAVTVGPGLIGALLVGVSFAKSLSYALHIPLLAIHHLEGHISSVFLEQEDISFPAIALVVSGGHTNLYKMPKRGEYYLLGKTLDDAAGEALDKGARLLGYEYPGGPVIDRLAKQGNPIYPFTIPHRAGGLNFSFSGVKTALRQMLQQENIKKDLPSFHADIAASYQKAIIESLVLKSLLALRQNNANSMILVGGVAANSLLRRRMQEEGERAGFSVYMPSPHYCTDNAAMIAMAGLSHLERGVFAPLDISPHPALELASFS